MQTLDGEKEDKPLEISDHQIVIYLAWGWCRCEHTQSNRRLNYSLQFKSAHVTECKILKMVIILD